MLRENVVPLAIFTIVAAALLLMVALGLTGVVWQSVTQRIREFGVRRAQGATAVAVGRQVIAELLVMVSFAVAAGCVLLLQIPLLPLPPDVAVVPRGVFVTGVVLAVAAVYSVTALCAWYPSRLATRVPPADALRYE
jgi:putative ABC transport system permease protein